MTNEKEELLKKGIEPKITNLISFNRKSNCWIWLGARNQNGYGIVRVNGKSNVRVHRFVWEFFNGEIKDNLCVLHKCDVRICVNPEHLFLGDRIENNKDRDLKGRNVIVSGSKNGMSKLNEKKVREIKNTLKYYGFKSFAELGRKYGVRWQTIQAIAKGKTWKNI